MLRDRRAIGLPAASAPSSAAVHREGRPVELGGRHRLGVDRFAVAADARHRQPTGGLHAGWAPLLEEEAVDRMYAHLIENLGGGLRAAVIAQQGFALGVERFEHVLAIAAGAETEAGPQLPLEDVEELPLASPPVRPSAWEKARSSRRSLRSCRICCLSSSVSPAIFCAEDSSIWRSASCTRAYSSGVISAKRFSCCRRVRISFQVGCSCAAQHAGAR
jgi:hypothetical protein